MSSPFLTRHKGNTNERFHTPRRMRVSLSSENIDPKEIQFAPVSKKPKDKFSSPRFNRIANDFEDDEISMTKYQNRINELKQEILE